MKKNILTIRVTGRNADAVSADDAIRALQDAIKLLEELEKQDGEPSSNSSWMIVGASMRSPLSMTIQRSPNSLSEKDDRDLAGPMVEYLRALDDENKAPLRFNDRMLYSASRIGHLVLNGVASISFETPDHEPYQPSQRLSQNADKLRKQRPRYYTTVTTLEGTLESIDVHGRPEFYIYDRLTRDAIRCFFDLASAADIGPLITKRIRVHGLAKYNRNHQAQSVQVQRFTPVLEPDHKIGDLHKRQIDITGGLDSVEYVRGLRNG